MQGMDSSFNYISDIIYHGPNTLYIGTNNFFFSFQRYYQILPGSLVQVTPIPDERDSRDKLSKLYSKDPEAQITGYPMIPNS